MTCPRSELVMGVSVLFSLILTCCLPHPVAIPYTIVSAAYLFSFILFLFFLGRKQKKKLKTQLRQRGIITRIQYLGSQIGHSFWAMTV